MDLVTLRVAIQPFVEFFATVIVSGAGVSYLTEFLKDTRISVPAEKYPRLTAGALSVLATFISIYLIDINLVLTEFWQFVVMAIGILFTSAVFYKRLELNKLDSVERKQ